MLPYGCLTLYKTIAEGKLKAEKEMLLDLVLSIGWTFLVCIDNHANIYPKQKIRNSLCIKLKGQYVGVTV